MSLKTLQLRQMVSNFEGKHFLTLILQEGFIFSFLSKIYFADFFLFVLLLHKETSLKKSSMLFSSEMKNIDILQMMKHGQILFHLLLNGSRDCGVDENNSKF